jgi:predicted DNA-binding transcriptional regulator AlpA
MHINFKTKGVAKSLTHSAAGSIEIQRMARVSQRLDVSKSLLFKMMAEGAFPQPFSINGGKATGWLSTTIDQWILQRAAAGSSARGVQK